MRTTPNPAAALPSSAAATSGHATASSTSTVLRFALSRYAIQGDTGDEFEWHDPEKFIADVVGGIGLSALLQDFAEVKSYLLWCATELPDGLPKYAVSNVCFFEKMLHEAFRNVKPIMG